MAVPPLWARAAVASLPKFIRTVESSMIRQRKLSAILMKKGRMLFNQTGKHLNWKAQFRLPPVSGYADLDVITHSRVNMHKEAELPWRGYIATDALSRFDELTNKGDEAIIKVAEQIPKQLMKSMDQYLGEEFYVDGEATGNEKRLHGIESFMSTSGAYAGGFIGAPNDTYAGLLTTLGNYGGNWSATTYPIGTGDYEYDFWSPLVIDYTDTAWTAATKTWANTCREAVRFAITHRMATRSMDEILDLILLNPELYRLFLEKVDASERVLVQRGQGRTGLLELGWGDVINYEGVEITSEYGVPANVGYGWAFGSIELNSLHPTLFFPGGPHWSESERQWRFDIEFIGNMRFFSPKPFVKFVAIT